MPVGRIPQTFSQKLDVLREAERAGQQVFVTNQGELRQGSFVQRSTSWIKNRLPSAMARALTSTTAQSGEPATIRDTVNYQVALNFRDSLLQSVAKRCVRAGIPQEAALQPAVRKIADRIVHVAQAGQRIDTQLLAAVYKEAVAAALGQQTPAPPARSPTGQRPPTPDLPPNARVTSTLSQRGETQEAVVRFEDSSRPPTDRAPTLQRSPSLVSAEEQELVALANTPKDTPPAAAQQRPGTAPPPQTTTPPPPGKKQSAASQPQPAPAKTQAKKTSQSAPPQPAPAKTQAKKTSQSAPPPRGLGNGDKFKVLGDVSPTNIARVQSNVSPTPGDAKKYYLEKQNNMFCGKHSLNAVFGQELVSEGEWTEFLAEQRAEVFGSRKDIPPEYNPRSGISGADSIKYFAEQLKDVGMISFPGKVQDEYLETKDLRKPDIAAQLEQKLQTYDGDRLIMGKGAHFIALRRDDKGAWWTLDSMNPKGAQPLDMKSILPPPDSRESVSFVTFGEALKPSTEE